MKKVLRTAQDYLGNGGFTMYNGDWYDEDQVIEQSALIPGLPTPRGVRIEGHEDDDIYVENYPLNEPWYAGTIADEGTTEEMMLKPDGSDVGGFVLKYTDA